MINKYSRDTTCYTYKSTLGACPLFTGIALSSVRIHKNSAHMHVMAAQAAFNNHQNGVGKLPLYHIHAAKCMMCIVHEKSKHNRYRSTIRQMNVALGMQKFFQIKIIILKY